jgi:hypothetical protein
MNLKKRFNFFTSFLVFSLFLAGNSPRQTAQAAPVWKTINVTIPAVQPWVNTGITIFPNQQISITAAKSVINDGNGHIPYSGPGGLGMVGPGGYSCTSNLTNPQKFPYLVASVPCESLVGYIGQSPPPPAPISPPAAFEVGMSDSFTASQGGTLYLSVNDNYFPDNSGDFTAEIQFQSSSTAPPLHPHLPIAMQQWFQGVWHGQTVKLNNVPNVTVENLPDAQLVGRIHNFLAHELPTSKPPFYCLNGETLNVWTAPNEFPGVYVVHNGDQGNQCTYGTWTF